MTDPRPEARKPKNALHSLIRSVGAAIRTSTFLPSVNDYSLIVLKGHLLIEEQINQIIEGSVPFPDCLPDDLTFSKKLALAKSLHRDSVPPGVWKAVTTLNRFRNDFAHELEPENIEDRIDAWAKIARTEVTPGADDLQLARADLLRHVISATYQSLVSVDYEKRDADSAKESESPPAGVTLPKS